MSVSSQSNVGDTPPRARRSATSFIAVAQSRSSCRGQFDGRHHAFRNAASLHVIGDVDIALRVEHRMLDEPVNPEEGARPVILVYPGRESFRVKRAIPRAPMKRREVQRDAAGQFPRREQVLAHAFAEARVEHRLESRVWCGGIVEQLSPHRVEEPLTLERPAPGLVRAVLRDVIQRRDVTLRADDCAADVVLAALPLDEFPHEVRLPPAQDVNVLIAHRPDDLVPRGRRIPVGIGELAAVNHEQVRRGHARATSCA